MNICVYGASSNTILKEYLQEGEALGKAMVRRGHGLVFGGGANGMMGAVARGVYAEGGSIIGVAPRFFSADGVLFEHCTELLRTDTMRERKQTMEDRADAFIMTPGGVGTFEEFFEILTLRQLRRHEKPIAILNTNGYYNDLMKMMHTAIEQDFLHAACLQIFGVYTAIEPLLDYVEQERLHPHSYDKLKEIEKTER